MSNSNLPYWDTVMVDRTISISKSTLDRITTEADRLNIPRSKYIELALMSGNPESRAWRQASKRYNAARVDRLRMGNLKRKVTWQERAGLVTKSSELKTIITKAIEEINEQHHHESGNDAGGQITDIRSFQEVQNQAIGIVRYMDGDD